MPGSLLHLLVILFADLPKRSDHCFVTRIDLPISGHLMSRTNWVAIEAAMTTNSIFLTSVNTIGNLNGEI